MYWEPFVSLFSCWQAAFWLFLPATISPPPPNTLTVRFTCQYRAAPVGGSTSGEPGVAGALAEADDGWRVWSE